MTSSRRVYSTDHGPTCPKCGRPLGKCEGHGRPTPSAGDGIVRVSRSSKGRKGKTVTLIEGVPLAGDELSALARRVKATCGAGGAVKDGVIEVQGDHRETVIRLLEAAGWRVKRKGG